MRRIVRRLTLLAFFVVALSNLTVAVYAQAEPTLGLGVALLGAGIAIGLTGYGAGVGMGTASAAAMGSLAEKPELFSKTLIYIVFIEAIAIYGLVTAFMIIFSATA